MHALKGVQPATLVPSVYTHAINHITCTTITLVAAYYVSKGMSTVCYGSLNIM